MNFETPEVVGPRLFLVGGYAGSGKTHFGDMLICHLLKAGRKACLLDKDTIERPILEAGLRSLSGNPDDRESELYMSVFRGPEYEGMLAGAINNLVLGVDVVLTAPFIKEFVSRDWSTYVESEAVKLDFSICWLWVTCSEDVAVVRLKERGASRDKWKLANWSAYLASLPSPYNVAPSWSVRGTVIQNTGNTSDLFDYSLPSGLIPTCE